MSPTFPNAAFSPWEAQVKEKLAQIGASSCAELLARFPGRSYRDVATELGGGLAPIALRAVYLREAKRTHRMRSAIADSLVRELNERLPAGWNTGDRPEFGAAMSATTWETSIIAEAGMPELEPVADRIWQALRDVPPPTGWRPRDAEDPLIRRAFDAGWPEHGVPSRED
jgi:hypothetical protein